MQINKISAFKSINFSSKNARNKQSETSKQIGELIKKMNSTDDTVLKLSGEYPILNSALITVAQYEREKNARAILKESKNVEHDLYSIETRALAILRFIKNGYSNWNHKEAFEILKNSNENHCKVKGKFYTLTRDEKMPESYVITRLYDSASVMFNSDGIVEEVRNGDYLMRTDAYYYDEGEGKPFLTCDGYSEKDGTINAQRTYYTGKRNCCFRDFKIENGKKTFSEYFDFKQGERNLILKSYKGKNIRLDLFDESNNKFKYKELSSGSEYYIQLD